MTMKTAQLSPAPLLLGECKRAHKLLKNTTTHTHTCLSLIYHRLHFRDSSPKNNLLTLYVNPNLYEFIYSVKQKRRCLVECTCSKQRWRGTASVISVSSSHKVMFFFALCCFFFLVEICLQIGSVNIQPNISLCGLRKKKSNRFGTTTIIE